MKKCIFKLLIFGLISITVSCENDSEKDLVDVTPPISTVTYENSVKTIIDNNCILCHNDPVINFAPMPLLTFDQVKEAVDNRGLLDRVSSNDPSFLMPAGGQRLPQATIDIILQWNTNGLLEQ